MPTQEEWDEAARKLQHYLSVTRFHEQVQELAALLGCTPDQVVELTHSVQRELPNEQRWTLLNTIVIFHRLCNQGQGRANLVEGPPLGAGDVHDQLHRPLLEQYGASYHMPGAAKVEPSPPDAKRRGHHLSAERPGTWRDLDAGIEILWEELRELIAELPEEKRSRVLALVEEREELVLLAEEDART